MNRAPPRSERHARLTRGGTFAAGITLVLACLAGVAPHPALWVLTISALTMWIIDAGFGWTALSQIEIRRKLPGDLFAGSSVPGNYKVYNHHGWAPLIGLRLEDRYGAATEPVPGVAPRSATTVRGLWRFPCRGDLTLDAVTVNTRYPFGLWERRTLAPCLDPIVVFPQPLDPAPVIHRRHQGPSTRAGPRRSGDGDILGLRLLYPGETPRRIHWRTSARLGRWAVLQRAQTESPDVWITVPRVSGAPWEVAISRAAAAVNDATRAGLRVGLDLPDGRILANAGPRWRRKLLHTLALLPRGGP